MVSNEVKARLAELIEPTAGEIRQAKQHFLASLADGSPASLTDLMAKYFLEVGVTERPLPGEALEIPTGNAAADSLDGSNSHIARERLRQAASIALSELSDEGLLVEVDGDLTNANVNVMFRQGNESGGIPIVVGRPKWGEAYQIARRFRIDMLPILDVDLFSANLADLGLDDRAMRCIREALEAYRRGLYLSCVSLLGAVSEGAWWLMAERFRGKSKALDAALDDGQSAATMMRLVSEEIAKLKGMRNLAPELYSQATYLRELRNYGIHPRGADPNAAQEHAFNESGCSVLLLSSHRYHEKLASIAPQVPG